MFFAQFTFFAPLFWPWCIYASCFTRTRRRPCSMPMRHLSTPLIPQ